MNESAYNLKKHTVVRKSEYWNYVLGRIQRTYLSKEFLTFIFCGSMGTFTNFLFSLALSKHLNPILSYVAGYAISLFVSYALNAKLLYKENYSTSCFIRFVISYIPNFLILFAFVFMFLGIFNWNKIIVYALAGLFGLPLTYILVKIYAFNRRAD
ncbi:MAG: GtrA family protein [Clostridia bacterium]|nr:GtrA family protein [Clostridia bacterium]